LGVDVDLVEIDTGRRSYGAGNSLGGATLRAFKTLGILDDFLRQGHAGDGVSLLTPCGQPIATVPTPRLVSPDIPGGGAILRPVLAGILANATRAPGTNEVDRCRTPCIASRTVVGSAAAWWSRTLLAEASWKSLAARLDTLGAKLAIQQRLYICITYLLDADLLNS
jgi:hypothetical protein